LFVAADRYIDFDEVRAYSKLREGDRIEGGRIIDAEGKPVPIRRSNGEVVEYRVCGESGEH
jgi:NCS2 family nucleobase:cation symporter-2